MMNHFHRNTRLEKHYPDGDPLNGGDPAPVPRSKKITCEFCECSLTPSGEFVGLSEKAKSLRSLSDDLKKALSEAETLRAKITDLEKELEAAKAKATQKRSFSF